VISVTSKSRYAVVALAELARSGDRPVPIKELAERRDIPEQFLEQLFSTLRRAGLLTSHRGMRGGYTLSRPAEEITVGDVVRAVGGALATVRGLPTTHATYHGAAFGLHDVWVAVEEAIEGVVDHKTLAELSTIKESA